MSLSSGVLVRYVDKGWDKCMEAGDHEGLMPLGHWWTLVRRHGQILCYQSPIREPRRRSEVKAVLGLLGSKCSGMETEGQCSSWWHVDLELRHLGRWSGLEAAAGWRLETAGPHPVRRFTVERVWRKLQRWCIRQGSCPRNPGGGYKGEEDKMCLFLGHP